MGPGRSGARRGYEYAMAATGLTALVGSLLGLGLGLVEWRDVTDRIDTVGVDAFTQVGMGLYLILVGSVVAAIASLVLVRAGRRAA